MGLAQQVAAGGRPITTLPVDGWIHVELEARVGNNAPRVFKLTLIPAGETTRVFENLAMSGPQFNEVHRLGFSSTATADAAFPLDNLKIKVSSGLMLNPQKFVVSPVNSLPGVALRARLPYALDPCPLPTIQD